MSVQKQYFVEFFYRYSHDSKLIAEAYCAISWTAGYHRLLETAHPRYFSTCGYSSVGGGKAFNITERLYGILSDSFESQATYENLLKSIAGVLERGMIPNLCAPMLLAAVNETNARLRFQEYQTTDELSEIERMYILGFWEFLVREKGLSEMEYYAAEHNISKKEIQNFKRNQKLYRQEYLTRTNNDPDLKNMKFD